ncbi:7-deoxyloganetic acid glucosyltransferase-like [Heracleum sosnowskyi]|uniref:7-deoxyloganetic acid glucosyltransferase-like n=1 Tax=Heracleum sosnowskyi TaxID=360622 RepID=A0AAD8HDC1_9APIA|nr:7-deoxyloganetic acid glucosyltransferase-like [Heracleum sosnowskyi]
MADSTSIPAHVVIFPFPVQGHMNSMFKLSELLCLAGIHVTYIVTVENHNRLMNNTGSWYDKYPGFRFQMLPENVSQRNVGQLQLFVSLYESLKTTKPFFRDLLSGQGQTGPVTCLITDGLMKFTLDVGEETGVPVIYFRTASPCSVWTYFCLDKLIESGDCPFQEDGMDTPIRSVPGMEGFLRGRDLPSLFRVRDMSDTSLCKIFAGETLETVRARGFILNTFEELDGPIISQISTKIPNIYSIGPLHALLKTRLKLETTSSTGGSSNSLREEDKSCIKWLDEQPLKSINSRYIGEVWKLGLDIKDTCDRSIIEKAVRDLMEVRKEEFAKSAKEMATLARKAVNEGGDSHNNLNKLIEDIKMMNVAAHHA